MSEGAAFQRIFIIVLENENATLVARNAYFASLAARGARLTNYHGVAHPSQPNYLAMIAGDTFGWDSDECTTLDQTNVVDLLEAANVGWRVFMEDLPRHHKTICVSDDGLYWRKHDPFVSFASNQTAARLSHIVEATRFDPDHALPPFVWYGPNIRNCGHTVPGSRVSGGSTANVAFAASWLEGFLEPLLANTTFMDGMLVVITFDEGWPPSGSDGPLFTVLLGPMIEPGTTHGRRYDHYSLLATIERGLGLGNLGRHDARATAFDFLVG